MRHDMLTWLLFVVTAIADAVIDSYFVVVLLILLLLLILVVLLDEVL